MINQEQDNTPESRIAENEFVEASMPAAAPRAEPELQPNNIQDITHLVRDADKIILIQQDPLRDIADLIRGELHNFIHSSIGATREPKIGFDGQSKQTVSLDPLKESISGACYNLEVIYRANPGIEGAIVRANAQALQSVLENFLLVIGTTEFSEGVYGGALNYVLNQSIQMKKTVSDFIMGSDMAAAGMDPNSAA